MAKKRVAKDSKTVCSVVNALDAIEPDLRHLQGLIAAFQILGAADDSIEPIAVSSLTRSAGETLEEVERKWRTAIGALRER